MKDRQKFPPDDSEDVPSHVLDELIEAFGRPERDRAAEIDFDDPSIDELLAPGVDSTAGTQVLAAGAGSTAPGQKTEHRGEVEVDDETSATRRLVEADPSGTTALARPGRRTTIRIGDDDELPDAVYLDEDAEKRLRDIHRASGDDSGSRSTIVIADLDESMPAVEQLPDRSSGAIDPRLRARRVAVGRAKGRRRLVIAGVVVLVLLIIVGVIATFASSLFDVRTIHWQGIVYTDPQLVQQVESQIKGDPVLLVDTRKIERQLEQSPWVDQARVTKHFPHAVTIDVRERQPVVTFQGGNDQQWRMIDRDGRVLAVIADTPDKQTYMYVTGANPDTELGASAGPLYAAAAQLWIAVPAEIRQLTDSIGVDTTAGTLSLELHAPEAEPPNDPGAKPGAKPSTKPSAEAISVRLGDPTNLADKLARLLQIVRRGLDTTVPIDVSTNDVSVTGG